MVQGLFLPEHVNKLGVGQDPQVCAQATALGVEAIFLEEIDDHTGHYILNRVLRRHGIACVPSI